MENYLNDRMSDNELYLNLFYRTFMIYGILINTDYQYAYDYVFNHIKNDSIKLVEKNSKKNDIYYKMEVFKKVFHNHVGLINILKSENFSEILRRIRKEKLNKLNKFNEYGMR